MGFFSGNKDVPPPSSETEAEDDNDIQMSAFVLLSEPLVFTANELVAALREDFPDMEWGGHIMEEVMGDMPQASGGAVVTQIGIGKGLKPALINTLPGHQFLPAIDVMMANRLTEAGMQTILEAGSYLNVAVWAPKDDLALRVEAGRRMAAIVSLLAGLPIARGVTWHPANRVATAEQWRQFSDDLAKGGLPTLLTTLLLVGPEPDHPGTVSGRTVGLAAYLDAELEVLRAPIEAAEAATMMCGAAKMLTEWGHRFADGHTVGVENAAPDQKPWIIRFRSAETHPTGIAHWSLVHPEAAFDHIEAFGRLPRFAGLRDWSSDFGWLRRQLKRDPLT